MACLRAFHRPPDIGKVRPVVILENNGERCLVAAAKITSQRFPEGNVNVYEIRNWIEHGLRKPSFIRLDQRFELPYSDLLSDSPIGSFTVKEFSEIKRLISEF